MRGQSSGFGTILVVILILGGFGYLLFRNAQPVSPVQVIVPTQMEPTAEFDAWQQILSAGFGDNSTPLPTIAVPAQPFIPPTLAPHDSATITPFEAAQLSSQDLFTPEPLRVGVTPTPLLPTPTFDITEESIPVQVVARAPTNVWQPPPLIPPINRDPQGRDHYWFARPIDSSGLNFGIPYYPYGSDGPGENNPLRIHHGIDIPGGRIGATVRAAGPGVVVFASSAENPFFQNTHSYGNVVVIEHDFGWNGQSLYTLYAHLERALATTGDNVSTGDPIGLVGNTGSTTGPHLHFEVRMGQNTYSSTYNPVLWMVPYVGHGTIAGRLVDERGNMMNRFNITLRNWGTGLVEASTTTYIFSGTASQVNSDPNWNENFVFPDVPIGRYEVIGNFDGRRVTQLVEVAEGMTSFVELQVSDPVILPTASSP
jgi:murein DD-endopeptidase MepM/ murein hydrolase activator NlpD